MIAWENKDEQPDYVFFPEEPQQDHESTASLIVATFMFVAVLAFLLLVPWGEVWELIKWGL